MGRNKFSTQCKMSTTYLTARKLYKKKKEHFDKGSPMKVRMEFGRRIIRVSNQQRKLYLFC
jgi:hypothetical protein